MAIVVPIVSSWNPKGLDKAVAEIKRAEGTFNKLGRIADITSASLINTGQTLTRNVTVPLAGLAIVVNKSITQASQLQEAQSKVTAVFKNQAGEVQKWAKTTSTAFGVSQRQALEAAGTYGNLFQAFGIGQTEARKMSTRLVELAADMASFNNVPIDEALTALRSGLSGETEPLKRFGVALQDVRLKEEALALGLIDTTKGVLPPAIKAQAAYALILKDTALQQGDVARTAGGLANQKKFLSAQVEDLSGTFGAVFTPVMINLVGVLRNSVLPQMQKFIEAFKTLSPNAITTGVKIGLFAAALGPAMLVTGYMIKMIEGLRDAFTLLTKRIVLIPAAILFVVAALVKGNDATMSWATAVFKVLRGVVIAFAQVGNAASFAINLIIKGYNAMQRAMDSGVTIKELGNLDFLIRAVDGAAVSYNNFSSTLKKEQTNLSLIVEEAKNLANSVGSGGAGGGGVASETDKASSSIQIFKDRLNAAKQVVSDAKSKFDDFANTISSSIKNAIGFDSALNKSNESMQKAAEASKNLDAARKNYADAMATGNIERQTEALDNLRAAEKEAAESVSSRKTFLQVLQDQAAKASEFGTKVKTLIQMGLSESAIGQVLQAGADAGTAIADEIIAGGAGVVDQVNTLLSATQSLADEIGISGATQFYDAGVKQGEALVQGVIDAIKAAGLTIDGTNADTIASATQAVSAAVQATAPVSDVKKSSTSKSKKKVKVPQAALRVPMLAEGGIVNRATLAIVGERGPEAVVPLNKSKQMGGTYNITVNAGLGADGASIGREIVDAIKRYERASGPVFASA